MNLNRLIDELGLLVRHKLKNQNVQLVRNIQANLPEVMGEAMQLEQAFLNLILNAAEAMPEGGFLTISCRALSQPRSGSDPSQVEVEFSDTGHGHMPDQRRQLFSSVLSTSKPKGTGLGLAIVRRVVETHRGELKIKSRPAKGTSVSVIIPIHLSAATPAPGQP